jgi:hypothetical protein
MTLRTFLLVATTVILLMTSIPVAVCGFVANQQHSERPWDVLASFPHVWFSASMLVAIIVLILSPVSFHRGDFLIGIFGLFGSLSVFFWLWVFSGHITMY